MEEKYYTTIQFQHLEAGFHKHCGPTAITNLIATLSNEEISPEALFLEVAKIGQHLKVYWNIDDKKIVGGTSDGLTGWYLRRCLKCFGLTSHHVRGRGLATPDKLKSALALGHMVFLQLHLHPKYHQHHVLIYGYEWEGFRTADGWSASPIYLVDKDLTLATFYEISES